MIVTQGFGSRSIITQGYGGLRTLVRTIIVSFSMKQSSASFSMKQSSATFVMKQGTASGVMGKTGD